MAELVLKDCKLLVGGRDMSGVHNSLTLTHSVELLDKTHFGDASRRRKACLRDFELRHSGHFGSTWIDKELFDKPGTTADVVTITPNTSEGAVAYLCRSVYSEYSLGGTVGELLAFDVAAVGTPASPSIIRGKLIGARYNTTAVANTSSTGINVGAASTVAKLYATVHHTFTTMGSTAGVNSSGGMARIDIIASCSSNFGTATTMLTIAKTSAPSGTWNSTKNPSTGRPWLKFRAATTGAKPHMSFFVAAGYAS